tara:strand:- start:383 stop:763 length:381 start_codon:yes stop_codon:yes gene_type:complete
VKKRFGDDLKININIGSEIQNNSVPPFALQMMIENAIKHNVLSGNHPLEIKIEQIGTHIRVENNLNPKPVTESLGIGLVNLNKRFVIYYISLMKKLLYSLSLTLTAFLIFYSCSAEEEPSLATFKY